MICKCKIENVNEEEVTINIDRIIITGFCNSSTTKKSGTNCLVELQFFDKLIFDAYDMSNYGLKKSYCVNSNYAENSNALYYISIDKTKPNEQNLLSCAPYLIKETDRGTKKVLYDSLKYYKRRRHIETLAVMLVLAGIVIVGYRKLRELDNTSNSGEEKCVFKTEEGEYVFKTEKEQSEGNETSNKT